MDKIEISFDFNGMNTIIQSKKNIKMKEILENYKYKIKAENKFLYYLYKRNIILNDELTFDEIANSEDKKRNKINLSVKEFFEKHESIDIFGDSKIKEEDNRNKMLIIYKIQYKNETLKIFGENFVENNINKCNMIIDGKEYKISEYFNISNLNDDNIDYLIIQLNDIKSITNISYMFHCCESLISLLDISRWNNSNITDMSYMF